MDEPDMTALDRLLGERAFVPARNGLAERIIATAHAQGRPQGFWSWLAEALGELMLPRPAFALASVLALGILIGATLPDTAAGTADEEASLQLYLDDEVSVL